jgi:hypothetical protein
MNAYRKHVTTCFCATLIASALPASAWADLKVEVTDSRSEFIQQQHKYELKVTAGDKDVIGVIVVNAFTVFGVGAASPVKPPTDWAFIPPAGPDSDSLCYASNKSDADIKANTATAGFLFEASKAVTSFKVDLVLAGGDVQEVTAQVPQPEY